jgi:hypothetical protein
MNASPHLVSYLARETLQRWLGRVSVPMARVLVAIGLSTTGLLVLASFALGRKTLEERVEQFGLDVIVVRRPLRHANEPVANLGVDSRVGRTLTLVLPFAAASLDSGKQVPLALARDETIRELGAWKVEADRLPVLLSSSWPSRIPVRATLGPWSVEAQTAAPPRAMRALGFSELLIVRPDQFPLQATLAGTAVTLIERASGAAPLEKIVDALQITLANNPVSTVGASVVESALPLLQELSRLKVIWTNYVLVLATMLALTIALVFGSAAILEYESTAYTTALLRSFGVGRGWIWVQRYAEAALLANIGGAVALAAAITVAREALPQCTPFLAAKPVILPVLLALNLGAWLAALPVAFALRRPVGLVLQ